MIDIKNLVIELKKVGLTQSSIAIEIGCSQPTISDIENGKIGTTRPSWRIVDGLKKMAKKRGIKANEFI